MSGASRHFDILILGAGYPGLMAALTLAEAGCNVALLDRLPIGGNLPPAPGENQSSISGGHVTYGYSQDYHTLTQRYGEKFARSLFRVSVEGVDLVEQTCAKYNIEDAAFRRGYMILPRIIPEREELEKSFSGMERQDLLRGREYLLDHTETQRRLASPEFGLGSLYSTVHGQLEPREYVLGLARAALNRGVTLLDQVLITGIRAYADGYEAHSQHGDIYRASRMIVCGGSFLLQQNLFPELRVYQAAIGNYAVKTEPLSENVRAALFPDGYCGAFSDMRRANVLYARLDSLNRLDFGAYCFTGSKPNAAQVEQLLYRTFPVLAAENIKIQYGRYGRLSGSLNEIAQIFSPSPKSSLIHLSPSLSFDPDHDRLLVLSALGSEGINMGTTLGQAAAHAFLGKPDVLNLFSTIRHRRLPVSFPWESANRVRDRFFGQTLKSLDRAASYDNALGVVARKIAECI